MTLFKSEIHEDWDCLREKLTVSVVTVAFNFAKSQIDGSFIGLRRKSVIPIGVFDSKEEWENLRIAWDAADFSDVPTDSFIWADEQLRELN